MDPNATLSLIALYLEQCEAFELTADNIEERADLGSDLDETCSDLYYFIYNDGFEPDWSKHELAASYYRSRIPAMR